MDSNEHDNEMWYSKKIGNFKLLATDKNVCPLWNFIRFEARGLLQFGFLSVRFIVDR
jgi:hypothetical protein